MTVENLTFLFSGIAIGISLTTIFWSELIRRR